MAPTTLTRPGGIALDEDQRATLQRRLERAVARARRRGGTLAALTIPLPADTDPSALVVASRRAGEPYTCLEQPARDGFALAALGCVRALDAHGEDRFERVAADWRALTATAFAGDDVPVAVGGFAFAPDGGRAHHWRGFPAASLHVPEVAVRRRRGEVQLTVAAVAEADDDAQELLARLQGRLGELSERPLPLLDPDPAAHAAIASTLPPEHYVEAVARAVERIRSGAFEKVVLAREVAVHSATDHDAAAVLDVLRGAFRECFCVLVGRGDAAFVAASPELLVRRDGMRAQTVALAGSTRRSADPAVDAHLGEQLLQSAKDRGEQDIVTRRISRTLRPASVWVAAADEPTVIKVANIQHLATPIRAQLREPVGAVELAGRLHPTPAVGGEPHAAAVPTIPALEGMDRGWYAGAIGWTDSSEDGEFCVGLRSALLRGTEARCFAGVGVVADSDPVAELAETEIKLQALLPVLAA